MSYYFVRWIVLMKGHNEEPHQQSRQIFVKWKRKNRNRKQNSSIDKNIFVIDLCKYVFYIFDFLI